MQMVIIGPKRAEICPVSKRNQDKVFFLRHKQLYRVDVENLKRTRIEKWGRFSHYEETEIYEENMTVPTIRYAPDKTYSKTSYFAMIRTKKNNAHKRKFAASKAVDLSKKLPAAIFTVLIVAFVVIKVIEAGDLF